MKIYPGEWSNGQLVARICWSGTWSGAVVGALVGVGLHIWLAWVAHDSDPSFVAVVLGVGVVVGAVLGLASGIVAALSAVVVVSRRRRRRDEVVPIGVAAVVLGVTSVVQLVVGAAFVGQLAVVWPILSAGPLFPLVHRQVRRECLQDLTAVVR